MTDRQRMAEHCFEFARATALQAHTRIVAQRGFGDRAVAGVVGQLDRHRRRGPFTILNFGNFFSAVYTFVMAFEVVIPDDAAGRYLKGDRLVGNSWLRAAE